MKADRKTTKKTGGGKSKTQKAQTTHKAAAPKPPQKKTVRKINPTAQPQIEYMPERNRVEEKLLASEVRYRRLFEAAKDGILILDAGTGAIVDVNPFLIELLGYTHTEFLGRQVWEIGLFKDIVANKSAFLKLQEQRYVRYENLPLETKDGRSIWVEFVSNVYEAGDTQVVQCNIRNITERKRAEEALRESEERISKIFKASPIAISVAGISDGKLTEVNDVWCKLMGFSREEAVGYNVEELKIIDSEHRSRIREEILSKGSLNLVDSEITTKSGEKKSILTSAELITIKGSLFSINLVIDITERKQAEEALQQAEIRYRALVEQTPAVIYTVDPRQPDFFVYVSQQIEALSGYSPQAWMADAQLWNNLIHTEDRERVLTEEIRTNNTGESFNIEYRLVHRDGHLVWVHEEARQLHDASGQPTVWQGFMLDITERKRAEDEIRRIKKFNENLINNMSEGIVVQNTDGEFTFVNPAVSSITGYPPEELIGEHWTKFIPADQHEIIKEADNRRLSGLASQYEIDFLHKSGKRINQLVSGSPLFENGRFNGSMAVFTDITERVLAIEKLHKSEEKYRFLFENNPLPMWVYDLKTLAFLAVNDSAVEKYGYTREEFLHMTIADIRPTEDVPRLMKNLAGQRPTLEHAGTWRHLLKDGSIIDVEITSHTLRMEEHDSVLVVPQDITERKRAQEKLRVQLDRLSALREIDQMISSTFGLSMSLNTLITHASRLLAVDAVSVLLLNSAFNRLEYGVGRGFRSPAIKTTSIKLGESYAGRAAIERRVIEIPNVADEPNDLFQTGFLKDEKFLSYYGAPLIVKGKVVGVLEVFHRSLVERDMEWHDFFSAMAGQAAIAIDNAKLFENLQITNRDLFQAYDATIVGWSRALDMRDKETEGHTHRVTTQTLELARSMGLSDEQLANIRRGALLHDIGKMGVPDNILLKPGALTDEEWEIMRKHPTFGFELLSPIRYLKSAAIDIPYCHHEKWDGTGYPRGLKGEQIPLSARIFAVIDVWDALTSDRPYRPAWSKEQALDHIRSLAGIHFDPAVVKAFLDSDLH